MVWGISPTVVYPKALKGLTKLWRLRRTLGQAPNQRETSRGASYYYSDFIHQLRAIAASQLQRLHMQTFECTRKRRSHTPIFPTGFSSILKTFQFQ